MKLEGLTKESSGATFLGVCDVRRVRVSAFVVAGWLGTATPAIAAPAIAASAVAADAAAIERARAAVLTSDYQTTLPDQDAARPGPVRLGAPRDSSAGTGTWRDPEAPGVLGSLISLLMWGCVFVAIALAAFWLARELLKYTEDVELPPAGAGPADQAATAAILDLPLGDADELARRGEYAEAIHTLLLRTLHELVRSAAVTVGRSHTSREILARVPVLADARQALAGLIAAVELTHFGDAPATAADYERCRQQFHRFAEAFRATGLPSRAPARPAEARA